MTTCFRYRTRAASAALVATTVAALALSGCSTHSTDTTDTTDTATTVEVTHSMGTTDVPVEPETVISFSAAWTDAFSALGAPVDLEFRIDGYDEDKPWAGNDSGDVRTYPSSADGLSAVNEHIATEDPDVIFVGWVPDQETYDRLNEIAPTVAVVGDNTQSDDWREVTELAGEILDASEDAAALVQDVDDRIAATREAHPSLDGASAAFGQVSEQGLAVVTDERDPANEFLTDLGMTVPEEIRAASEDGARAFISEENIDLLDTDFLAMWAIGVDPADVTGWNDLTAVRNGAAYLPDSSAAMALSQPTVLSVPWTLDELDGTFAAVE